MRKAADDVRKGQAPDMLARAEFGRRFRTRFAGQAYAAAEDAVAQLEEIAWREYEAGNKSPHTRRAGPGHHDPEYELSLDWLAARERVLRAAERHAAPATPSRLLLVCAASRNDGTCPGEISKTFRLCGFAREALAAEEPALEIDFLDLSLLSSEYGRRIHPCKACVSTAMPLCHWPCSCYPNHGMGQTGDWMAEIYERWTLAHGVLIVTPVYWYQVPSGLKLMIDRLVCADGGNPDPTSTSGKDPKKAKALELAGWPYPKHLAGRAFGVVVHGDVAGIESVRRSLCDWLEWMGLRDAGGKAKLDRYVGYYEPYATSHRALDEDTDVAEEVRNAARAVARAIRGMRAGEPLTADAGLESPRPK
jgi:multimeric flavodoxin WrbA